MNIWNGNSNSVYDLPEGLTRDTVVDVWGKEDRSDVERDVAGNFDWRWWANIPEEERNFLQHFGIGPDEDIKFYEVVTVN